MTTADIVLLRNPKISNSQITGTANVHNVASACKLVHNFIYTRLQQKDFVYHKNLTEPKQLRKNTYNDPDAKVCMRFSTSGDWRLNLPVWQDANMSSRLGRESTLQADVSGIHLMKPKASLQAHRNTDWLQRNNDVTSQHTGNQCKTLVTYYATCRI